MALTSDGSAAAADARVAVVVSVFNKAPFVAATLRSLMRQTYGEIELVVVDDGSTDGSSEIVRQTLGDFPARVIALTNGGVSRARNVGAAEASDQADYLLFLDADDLLGAGAIASLVGHLERHPEAVACYCRLRYIDTDGRPLSEVPSDVRWAWSTFGRRQIPDECWDTPVEALWSRFWAIPSCCLVRRTAFVATNGWDPALCPPTTVFGAEDKDMAIQLALQGQLHRLPQPLVDYRVMASDRKQALYDGLRALNVKWWSADLSDESRNRVRRAIRFDYRVAALDALGAFGAMARHPNADDALSAGSRLLRASARYALAVPLMNRWSRSNGGVRRRTPLGAGLPSPSGL